MASFNRVIMMGNITRDIELKYLQSGTAVTEIGLAMNDRRKTATGEFVDEVTFVDVTLWGRDAEIASEYLGKGSPVLIEGRLKLDSWETDGQKRSKLRVVCEKLRLVGNKGGGGGGGGRSNRQFDESEFTRPAASYDDMEPAGARSGGGGGNSSVPAAAGATSKPDDEIPF